MKLLKMKIQNGDILSAESGIIVHGCNAQGKMESGIAAYIRATYPAAYHEYNKAYENQKGLTVGTVVFAEVKPDLWIANAITQEFYGRDKNRVYVDYSAINKCFATVAELARRTKLDVHFPKIGAGLANGDWNIIANRIEDELSNIPHTLWIYN
ncbi:MAG: macro domain-containing protein [Candidatus Nitrosotenuis sp.]